MAKSIKVFCKNCKKPIYRSAGRFNENLKFRWNFYCSWGCQSEYFSKKRELKCENCGKRFSRAPNDISPHNYCSQSCAAKVNNKKHPKRKAKLKTCIWCDKQYRKRKGGLKYCSIKCRIEAKRRYTPEQLIGIIKQTTQELKRVPAKRELKEIADICTKSFGSWNKAIIAAGLQPNRSHSQRMYRCINTKAADGHICDSVSELLIDNWLAENKIPHERNMPYPETNHKADWLVFMEGQKVFVEYFGLANDSPRYDRAIKEKKKLCYKNKISLIAIYPQNLYPKEFLEENLKNKFKKFLIA